MAIQLVNVGTTPNDGTGDPLRDAFVKLNANDQELYDALAALVIGTDVQAYDADLTALAALVSAANKLPYATGAGTWAMTDFTSYARTLLDDADASAARTTLELVPGTNVQAYDATLAAVAGLTIAADKGIYGTGADAFSTYDLTAGGRALGGVAGTANTLPYFSALNTVTLASITAAGLSMVAAADASAQRTLLSLVPGTDVQAYDADLAAIAALTSAADKVPYSTGAGAWAMADFTTAGRALMDDASAAAQRTTLNVDGSRFDLTSAPVLYDEFMFGSTESGEMGELGWGFTNGTWTVTNAVANHPGIAQRTSTAVNDVVASVFPGGGGATPALLGSQLDEQHWVILLVTTNTDADYRFGFSSDWDSAAPTHAAYFEKKSTDTNWFGVNRLSSVESTRADTGVAAAHSTWFNLQIRRVSSTVIGYTINGGTEVQVSTHSPEGVSLVFGFHIVPKNSAARSVNVDAFAMRLQANTR